MRGSTLWSRSMTLRTSLLVAQQPSAGGRRPKLASVLRRRDITIFACSQCNRTFTSVRIQGQQSIRLFSSKCMRGDEVISMDGETLPKFADLKDLSSVSKEVLSRAGIHTMTEIQHKSWDPCLKGKDVIGRARTGTGKSLAFLLPSIERIRNNPKRGKVQMLIISPTRELAHQIGKEANLLTSGFERMESQTMYGGVPKTLDIRNLQHSVPTILTATPGRLLDHMTSTKLSSGLFRDLLDSVQVLVLDEMDSLLDMGFRQTIQDILLLLPHQRQTLLFSATVPKEVQKMINQCTSPDRIIVDCIIEEDVATHTNEKIDQSYVTLPNDMAVWGTVQILLDLMKGGNNKVLVFFPTTAQVCYFARLFNLGLGRPVLEIHSKLTQRRRSQTSDRFRYATRGCAMFTSDVSARGVDYPNVTHVVQVGMVPRRETYIHRLGRTGRAGKRGKGLLVLTELEIDVLNGDLQGLEIYREEHLEARFAGGGGLSASLEDERIRITGKMRSGELSQLEADAQAVYTSLLGFYFSKLRSMGMKSPQDAVVEIMTSFCNQAGLAEIPELPKKMADQYQLKNHPCLNVRSVWRPGSTFNVGRSVPGTATMNDPEWSDNYFTVTAPDRRPRGQKERQRRNNPKRGGR